MAFVSNRQSDESTYSFELSLRSVGLTNPNGYTLYVSIILIIESENIILNLVTNNFILYIHEITLN